MWRNLYFKIRHFESAVPSKSPRTQVNVTIGRDHEGHSSSTAIEGVRLASSRIYGQIRIKRSPDNDKNAPAGPATRSRSCFYCRLNRANGSAGEARRCEDARSRRQTRISRVRYLHQLSNFSSENFIAREKFVNPGVSFVQWAATFVATVDRP